jgi:hypothetical protein
MIREQRRAAMSEREKAQATVEAWIAEIISEIGPHDEQAALELLFIRHEAEMHVNEAVKELLLRLGCDEAVKPYVDQGLSAAAAADAAYKDTKRAAEKRRDRQHKRH